MNKRQFRSTTLLVFILLIFSQCSHTGSSAISVNMTQDALFLKNSKFGIGEIEGWYEAVEILEGSLANSLLDMYTNEKEKADYIISGNIFAKKYWRTRRYVYYTVNLRVTDKKDDVLMSFRNKDAFMQLLIDEFTMNIVGAIKNQIK